MNNAILSLVEARFNSLIVGGVHHLAGSISLIDDLRSLLSRLEELKIFEEARELKLFNDKEFAKGVDDGDPAFCGWGDDDSNCGVDNCPS